MIKYIFALLFFIQQLSASGSHHTHNYTKEQKLRFIELIGQYYADRIPFSGLTFDKEQEKAFYKGINKGISGNFEVDAFKESQHDIQETLHELVKNAESEKSKKMLKDLAKKNIPLDIPMDNSNKGQTTLKTLLKGKKALYIDFWASWCQPCMYSMPKLVEKHKVLSKKGVAFVGLNNESKEVAEKIKKQFNINFAWLIQPDKDPYSTILRIEKLPTIIILNQKGKVLFHGHPSETDKQNEALRKAGINI